MMYNCYSPTETAEIVSRAGVIKANMRIDKIFMSGVMAGMLLAFACATLLSTNASPWYSQNAPGLLRTVAALVFPYGLCMVVLTGSDLATGSFLYTAVSVLHRRLSVWKMLQHWALTFFGNLAGSLFVAAIIFHYGGVFEQATYKSTIQTFVTSKQVTPDFHEVFLRAIGANWLVCLACFLGMAGRELVSKIIGIWWPTFAFVSLGLDHVIANMTFIPLGIFAQTPHLTVGLYIWKGIIPALLGNIIGGAFFVGAYFWYMNLQGQPMVYVDGQPFGDEVEDAIDPRNGNINFGKKRKQTADEETLAGIPNNADKSS